MKPFLDYASHKYYEGNPVISDAEFDRLAEEHGYECVGASVKSGFAHTYPMYSLKKCYVGEKPIELVGETVETPKLDGAAVSLLYVEGVLRLALTRGDGKRGLDITWKMKYLVPNSISCCGDLVQIEGEVVADKSIPNARNYAAGALNLKDNDEFEKRELKFVAYGFKPAFHDDYKDDMALLKANGFDDVFHKGEELAERYPTDGRVVRLNSNRAFEAAGYTSSHPKGAYALKERQEGVRTRLVSVDWQVGRSGIVSPVAILEPILVGDATVSRATLHNKNYIKDLNLEIGCEVEIVRSGEIIPRVVRRVD